MNQLKTTGRGIESLASATHQRGKTHPSVTNPGMLLLLALTLAPGAFPAARAGTFVCPLPDYAPLSSVTVGDTESLPASDACTMQAGTALTIAAPNGSLGNLGTLTVGPGSTLTNNANLDNTPGATLSNSGSFLNSTSGVVQNSGATINAGGGTLNNDGTIINLGSLENLSNGTLINLGTVTNVTAGTFSNLGSTQNLHSIDNFGQISNLPGASLLNSGTLTNNIGSSFVNFGNLDNVQTITNSGSFRNEAGATLSNQVSFSNTGRLDIATASEVSGSGGFVQTAGATTVESNALLSQEAIQINGGTLSGAGKVASLSTISLGPDALLAPGESGTGLNTMTVSATSGLSLAGTLNINIYSPTSYSHLDVLGMSGFSSTTRINFFLSGDAAQYAGESFQFLRATGLRNFDLATINVSGLPATLGYSVVAENGSSLVLNLFDAPPTGAPEPGSLSLLTCGMMLLGGGAWRRRRQRRNG
jgi:hypothetical protein